MVERLRLSPEDLSRLRGLDGDITAVEREIERAERAGLDVKGMREDLKKSKALRDTLLREYS